jgi:hypothetical protein
MSQNRWNSETSLSQSDRPAVPVADRRGVATQEPTIAFIRQTPAYQLPCSSGSFHSSYEHAIKRARCSAISIRGLTPAGAPHSERSSSPLLQIE